MSGIPKKSTKAAETRELDRTYATETTINGRHVTRGTELAIEGIRGRCVFVSHVTHHNGNEWIDVTTSRGYSRTVRPDAVKTVHRSRRTGVAAA